MPACYFKRFRLACDLRSFDPLVGPLSPGYDWVPWTSELIARHSRAKFDSFHGELDAEVFECFTNLRGCQRLMREIADQPGFCPEATWLVQWTNPHTGAPEDCGTIQGVLASPTTGSIQNVGVHPEHRGQGLGRALVARALAGFRQVGCTRVTLEVTAANAAALHLYRELGFRTIRTMFRQVPFVEV